jgi:hypothetical protein
MWHRLPVKDRMDLMESYKRLGYGFNEMKDHFNKQFAEGGKTELASGGENHLIYKKESPTGNGKGIEGHIMVNHPTKDKGKWDTIDLTDITNYKVKTVDQGVASVKKWHEENPEYKHGGMIKRADGSYSKRGLWDNIRANAGSGKQPTAEMLRQERSIKNKYEQGGLMRFEPGGDVKIGEVPDPKKYKTSSESTTTGSAIEPIYAAPNIPEIEVFDYSEPDRIKQQRDIIQLTKPKHNYAITDKVANKMYYYDPSGKIIKSESVITGKSNNDVDKGLSMADWFKQTGSTNHEDYFKYLEANKYQTTPSGIYHLSALRNDTATDPNKFGRLINFFRPERAKEIHDARIRDYGEKQKMFTLTDEQGRGSSKAIHGTANPIREEAFAKNDPTGENRNLSNGCINVNGETICFDTLEKGSGMYILPEENTDLLHPKLKHRLFQKHKNGGTQLPTNGLNVHKGIPSEKNEDSSPLWWKGSRYPSRIQDEAKRDEAIKNYYWNVRDEGVSPNDALRTLKENNSSYGSDRFTGTRPDYFENYHGFDYNDINDNKIKQFELEYNKHEYGGMQIFYDGGVSGPPVIDKSLIGAPINPSETSKSQAPLSSKEDLVKKYLEIRRLENIKDEEKRIKDIGTIRPISQMPLAPTTREDVQDAIKYGVNVFGAINPYANVLSSAIDLKDGDYVGAALGAVPYIGQELKVFAPGRRIMTKLFNAGVPFKTAEKVNHAIRGGIESLVGVGKIAGAKNDFYDPLVERDKRFSKHKFGGIQKSKLKQKKNK